MRSEETAMNPNTTIYFSKLLGARLFGDGGEPIGRLRDLIVDVGGQRPKAVAAAVSTPEGERLLDFGSYRVMRTRGRYSLATQEARDAVLPAENLLYIRKHLLDKQIVDVDGRKLVRVNDLVLDAGPLGSYLVAVDVGLEGRFRRLGLAGALSALLSLFKKSLPGKLILWNEVEAVDFSSTQIKLSKAYSKLDGIHPSDLADILEELDHASRVALFNSLDEERAADVLEELEPGAQVKLLENLSEEKAADVLEKMPADEAADILDELKAEKAERLLAEMETASSSEVRSLMAYPEDTVGSLMSKDYVFFNQSMKVADAMAELRAIKPEAEVVYNVYVLDARGKYVATVSLRDIVVSDPEARLGEIMNSVTDPLHDTDGAGSLAELMLKYKLHTAPVVDAEGKMAGTIVIEDVLEYVMNKR
jgi:flagellar motility protein MotE (MotC chaperone)/sporulation protein YlmC with PRC-barrel domain